MGEKIAWYGGSALRSSELTRKRVWKLLSLAVIDLKLRGVMERTVVEKYPEGLGSAGAGWPCSAEET